MIIIKRIKKEALTIAEAYALKALGYQIECNNGKITKIYKKEA